MIHVCFALFDKTGLFSKFTGTTILSMFENTASEVTVHILCNDTVTDDIKDKFFTLAERYNQIIKFYDVEKICADKIAQIIQLIPKIVNSRFTIATFYRFFVSDVLPQEIEKVIYLDSDIVVNLDINELWQYELGDKVLAVIPNAFNKGSRSNDLLCEEGIVKGNDYFNAGVLMINLKLFSHEGATLLNGTKFINENPRHSVAFDQSILNYCFSTRTLKLPVKFNRLAKWARHFKESQAEKMIYHFNSHDSIKGLGTDMSDPFNRLWMSYYIKTPWFDADSIGRLHTSFLKIRGDLKTSAMKLSALVSGKSRGFFIEAQKTERIRKLFSVRADEIIIPAKNPNSIQELIDAMKARRGSFIFFIMTRRFPIPQNFPFDRLIEEGFVEGVDFIKGWDYLNLPMDTNSLIQAM